jgi:hypothetical protein
LPLRLRNSKANIIHFLTREGYIYDFNRVMSFIEPSFDSFLHKTVFISELNMSIRVKLFVVIGDAPARAKMLKTHQHNGSFGCFHCLNPSRKITIYDYVNASERSNKTYMKQDEIAMIQNKTFQGIKGECYFSKYITLPERSLIDYMHCCILGTVKTTIEIQLDSQNSGKRYYIGDAQNQILIDSVLQKNSISI